MMGRALLFLILFLGPISVSAERISAERAPGQDWQEAASKAYSSFYGGVLAKMASSVKVTPRRVSHKLSELDYKTIDEIFNLEELQEVFEYVRDLNFIDDKFEESDFLRRISWLYPEDGCFTRAAMMNHLIKEGGYKVPQRVFVFGNLRVKTANSISGSVRWWYHTAPIVRVGKTAYVLDPAIDPNQPLKLSVWLSRQSYSVGGLDIAICSSGTYDPHSSCKAKAFVGLSPRISADQVFFLKQEWGAQLSLGLDPHLTLHASPPWLR